MEYIDIQTELPELHKLGVISAHASGCKTKQQALRLA